MRRRGFIAGLGAAAAWPMVARGQQSPTPVIGYLGSTRPNDATSLPVFHQALKDAGYVEGIT